MHFIVDENIPGAVARALVDAGYTVSRPDPGTPDDEICEIASSRDAIVLTQDHDFSDMIFRDGMSLPGLVLIRMRNALPDDVAKRVAEVTPDYALGFAGNITVIDPQNVRVRELP